MSAMALSNALNLLVKFLTKIAMALHIEDDLRNLFTQVPYRNLQEVINEQKQRDSGVL